MLAVKKPKYVMLENVKGLLTEKMRKYFFQYLKDLDSFGYTSFYKVLNAKDYGIPQNRERIFVISILRTEDEPNPEYHFPSPIKLETTVEDILEDGVSPEYFLSQPLLEKYLWYKGNPIIGTMHDGLWYQQDLNGMLECLMFQSEVTHVSFLPSPYEDRERKNPSHHR